MIKAATIPLGLFLLFSAGMPACFAQAAVDPTAINEIYRRDAARIELRQRLVEAEELQARNDLASAGKVYDRAWDLVLLIGPSAKVEAEQVQTGLANVR